jgi:hypothetical protein
MPSATAAPYASKNARTRNNRSSRSSAKNTTCTTTKRFVAASPSSGSRCVPSSFAGALAWVPSLSRGPVGCSRASGNASHSRAARAAIASGPCSGSAPSGSS